MKILILDNKTKWTTWDAKINALKAWFSPIYDLVVDRKEVSFSDMKFNGYMGTDKIMRYTDLDKAWITKNLIPLATGYDVVMFTMKNSENKMYPIQASSIGAINGIQVIHGGCDEYGQYSFTNGVQGITYPGDLWYNIFRHELCHAIYDIQGKQDNTHKYWIYGTPEKCLEELKQTTPMYKYFKPYEIVGLKPELVALLDKARGIAGVPFRINSGKRTVEGNKKAGGVPDSAHLTGLAVDIACTTDSNRWKIIDACRQVGFNRIGIAKTFIHVDIDKSKSPNVIWLYD